jgi:hypothetical protein
MKKGYFNIFYSRITKLFSIKILYVTGFFNKEVEKEFFFCSLHIKEIYYLPSSSPACPSLSYDEILSSSSLATFLLAPSSPF